MVSIEHRRDVARSYGGGRQGGDRQPRLCGVIILAVLAVLTPFYSPAAEPAPANRPVHCIKLPKDSLLHLGSLDSFDRTEAGIAAAKLVIECVETKRLNAAHEASKIYEEIIPNENFGGEYTALQWLCDYIAASPETQKRMLSNRHVENFYRYWSANDFAALKQYIRFKYKINNAAPKTAEENDRLRFQEDFILFNNPRRERWEKTSEFLKALALKPGQSVVDIGSGPGYYTFKFADIVGEQGKVYASDNNDRHIQYMKKVIAQDPPIRNVELFKPSLDDVVGIPKGLQVDCVFVCSLYHIVYTAFTEEERQNFVAGIKRAMKPNARLVIVDNGPVEKVKGKRFPYHGPHIAKELIVAQLEQYGFTLKEDHQIIPQRYMLIFDQSRPAAKDLADPKATPCEGILINTPASLIMHRKLMNPFEFSPKGRAAARIFYKALDKKDKVAAADALKLYRELSTTEKIGNEYTAFAWFCEYMLAAPDERAKLIDDKRVRDYFMALGGDEFTIVKKFVRAYYVLDTPDEDIGDPKKVKVPDEPVEEVFEWLERIVFNNPRRETWEKSSKVLDFLKLKPEITIADVGCGPGYYSFKFSDIVGPKGRVFALETNQDALNEFEASAKRLGLKNIVPRKSTYDNCGLPAQSVDVMFLCSLYESGYVTSIDFVQERFIESMKKALKKDGRLVILDNEINTGDAPPYFGPRIDRRLIIGQLKHYGFKLVESAQFIPQRYVLVFQLADQP